ncbi:hypothetical protein M23134_03709 [Microscilla marina ATCC 23134]|uniref:Uncharacterized protein n=1 Tax=Microscilla marina ATCC 23134 TaxID=313606 RepID=A1ZXC2_MICM2|nr:hypothetical protein M23134_03709 [Microscilla marina ATCC 23134]
MYRKKRRNVANADGFCSGVNIAPKPIPENLRYIKPNGDFMYQ